MSQEIKFKPEFRKWMFRQVIRKLTKISDIKLKGVFCFLIHPAILTLPVEAYDNLPLVMKGKGH